MHWHEEPDAPGSGTGPASRGGRARRDRGRELDRAYAAVTAEWLVAFALMSFGAVFLGW